MKTVQHTTGRKYSYKHDVLQLEVGDVLIPYGHIPYTHLGQYELENTFTVVKVGVREAKIVSNRNPEATYRIENHCGLGDLKSYGVLGFEQYGVIGYARNFYLLNSETKPELEKRNQDAKAHADLQEAKRNEKQAEINVYQEKRRVEVLGRIPVQVEETIAKLKLADLSKLDFQAITNLEGLLSQIETTLKEKK